MGRLLWACWGVCLASGVAWGQRVDIQLEDEGWYGCVDAVLMVEGVDAPLVVVLERLVEITGVEIVFDPEQVEGQRVECREMRWFELEGLLSFCVHGQPLGVELLRGRWWVRSLDALGTPEPGLPAPLETEEEVLATLWGGNGWRRFREGLEGSEERVFELLVERDAWVGIFLRGERVLRYRIEDREGRLVYENPDLGGGTERFFLDLRGERYLLRVEGEHSGRGVLCTAEMSLSDPLMGPDARSGGDLEPDCVGSARVGGSVALACEVGARSGVRWEVEEEGRYEVTPQGYAPETVVCVYAPGQRPVKHVVVKGDRTRRLLVELEPGVHYVMVRGPEWGVCAGEVELREAPLEPTPEPELPHDPFGLPPLDGPDEDLPPLDAPGDGLPSLDGLPPLEEPSGDLPPVEDAPE